MSEESKELKSVIAGLFYGEVDENDVFPFPSFSAEQKEMSVAMIDAVEKYAQDGIDAAKMDEESKIPDNVLQDLAGMGLMGLGVPEELGGLGLDHTLYARVFAAVASIDGSIATTLGAHQSIGYKALLNDGNDEQKAEYLPKLASGEWIGAFCLTEPGSGSDAYSIKTKAIDNGDGTFTLNGQKLWITNAGTAHFYTVFCKTDHEKDGKTVEKISCFIVTKDMEGVSFGEKEKKMGIKASETRAVFFDNVKVPAKNMIGEPGKGFKIAMNVLNAGRLSLGSGSVGGMKYALKLAIDHAAQRKQFGDTINNFGIIQDKLSTMAANIYAAESLVYFSTGRMDMGQKDYSLESAISKVFCSEKLWETVDMSMQIAGGTGYMTEYPYERMMRDSRINLIFEGTNEILRIFTALSGMRGPGESLKDIGRLAGDATAAMTDPIKSVGVLTSFAKNRFGKMMSKTLTKCHNDLEDKASTFSELLSDFAIEVENTLMKYGKNIIGNELPQQRIADMAISLYGYLCVLSRTTSILNNSEIDDSTKEYVRDLTTIACEDLKHTFMKAYKDSGKNHDKETKRVAGQITERMGYGFDIIDF